MTDNHFGSVGIAFSGFLTLIEGFKLHIYNIPCSCYEESETTKISRPWQRADLFEESEKKWECKCAKASMWWKMEKASRHAKCFDVLCVCVDENIFQKKKKGDILPLVRGDILLKHVEKKTKKNTKETGCACSWREAINAHLSSTQVEPLEDVYNVLLRALSHHRGHIGRDLLSLVLRGNFPEEKNKIK